MNGLPEGWANCELSDVVEVLDAQRIPLNSGERAARTEGKPGSALFPYYGATGLVGYVDDYIFDEPLILLGEDGVPFLDLYRRKAYRISGKAWVNNHAHVLRPISWACDSRFIEAYLNCCDYAGHVTGTTRLKLTQAAMNRLPLPLAPLPEQKRIADKLDSALARVDACLDRLDRIPALFKRFRQSVLAAATSGRLTEDWRAAQTETQSTQRQFGTVNQRIPLGDDSALVPMTWGVHKLKDLISKERPLCYGVVQPRSEVPDGPALIRVQDMEGGVINVRGLRTISHAVDAEYRRSRVLAGDLLVSIVGTIGRTAVVPDGFSGNIARAVARIAPAANVRVQWINFWLSSPSVQWWLVSSSREVARKTLNLAQLAEIPVARPPLAEQHEIVRRVETLFAFADRLEARCDTARKQAGQLTPALLAKAFRGELVPQDPADEPAAELLKRLAARRAEAPKTRRGRKPVAAGE